jgi:hypothetical protein
MRALLFPKIGAFRRVAATGGCTDYMANRRRCNGYRNDFGKLEGRDVKKNEVVKKIELK